MEREKSAVEPFIFSVNRLFQTLVIHSGARGGDLVRLLKGGATQQISSVARDLQNVESRL